MNTMASQLLLPQPQAPKPGSQCKTLLEAYQRGEKLTVAEALSRYGIYALSQRNGDLRRLGHPILGQMVEVSSGKHIKQYWME